MVAGHILRKAALAGVVLVAVSCKPSDKDGSDITGPPPGNENALRQVGFGAVNDRYTAEVWARGNTAYTTTWGTRGLRSGNAVKIWDVSTNTPTLVDSLIVPNAGTLGDVQVSDDGAVMVVAAEYAPNGGIAIYTMQDPRKPQLATFFTNNNLRWGVHTAEVARVNGRLYAFCSVDPANGVPARLVIVDITNPSSPVETTVMEIGYPFVHDVFVRDGLLFAAEWHQGVGIYDIGARGGSIENPRLISRAFTIGGSVHNMWWFHDPSDGARRYLFVGEEGPGAVGSTSSGNIHVVDLSDLDNPREVAYYRVDGAGTHNFSMDESRGILYAAYYNGGVRALDARGDLGVCTSEQRSGDGRCMLHVIEGREIAIQQSAQPVYIWGVHFTGTHVYASDMLRGIYKFEAVSR